MSLAHSIRHDCATKNVGAVPLIIKYDSPNTRDTVAEEFVFNIFSQKIWLQSFVKTDLCHSVR